MEGVLNIPEEGCAALIASKIILHDKVKPRFVINPETMNYQCNWCHNEDIIIKAGTSVCTFKCPKCGNVDKF